MGFYRKPLIEGLACRMGSRLRVYAGHEFFDPTVTTDFFVAGTQREMKTYYMAGRRLAVQTGHIADALSCDVLVLEFNPRLLTNWPLFLIRNRLLASKATVLWGHLHSRKGPGAASSGIRRRALELADAVLLYTETEAKELRKTSRIPVVAARNALYRLSTGPSVDQLPQRRQSERYVYVGRLVPEKKVNLLIAALARMTNPPKLTIVGTGPERARLEGISSSLGVEGYVEFLGPITDPNELALIYRTAYASLSPGYVGLAMTQSHWFGVPMVYSANEPHAPEVENAREMFNAKSVEHSTPEAWAEMFTRLAQLGDVFASPSEIASDCRGRYSLENMESSFIEAINSAWHARVLRENS